MRAFHLALTTDFADVDFPAGTLSPTHKRRAGEGWRLAWDDGTLVADAGVGMVLPQRLNPGPWVSRVTFYAPVSLFLFFFVWLRATFPRLRYDQLMAFGWKVLLPASLLNLVVTATVLVLW